MLNKVESSIVNSAKVIALPTVKKESPPKKKLPILEMIGLALSFGMIIYAYSYQNFYLKQISIVCFISFTLLYLRTLHHQQLDEMTPPKKVAHFRNPTDNA